MVIIDFLIGFVGKNMDLSWLSIWIAPRGRCRKRPPSAGDLCPSFGRLNWPPGGAILQQVVKLAPAKAMSFNFHQV
jgi:hypothetical protein